MPEFSGWPTTIEALVIIALVISPGYVLTQTARRSIAHIDEPTDIRFLLTIITAGVGIQAIFFPIYTTHLLAYYVSGTLLSHQTATFVWLVGVCFIAPFLLGAMAGKAAAWDRVDRLLDKVGLGNIDRMPSAWDFAMLQNKPRYVRIHLADGKGVVGGLFQSNSLASTNPQRADLYLEEAWQLNDKLGFEQPLPWSSGVWIAHHVIDYIYFYEGGDDPYVKPSDSAADPEDPSGAA